MNEIYERFLKLNEFYAAGLFEEPTKSPFIRFSRGLRRYLENYVLQPYNGEALYPCGERYFGNLVRHDYSFTVEVDWPVLNEKDQVAALALEEVILAYKSFVCPEHSVGGNMYTHSYPNFQRIAKEGFLAYEERILKIKDEDIKLGLLDVLEGIKAFHKRMLKHLKENGCEGKLYEAFERVPFYGAKNIYEALVCRNFVYYLDGCDNIGRLDNDLIEYYNGEDITNELRQFFMNVDINSGWSGALGPEYNPITLQCLKASKGLRRPSLELRVTEDMPKEVWNAALDSIYAGGGSPSLYNEKGYQQALERIFPEIPEEDRLKFAGGGCTETMLAGVSNVGSLDAGINLALIFERFLRENLNKYMTFEEFYRGFIKESRKEIEAVLIDISRSQELRAKYRPQPMRTLLIDDCIEKGKDFNNGGTRYAWSVVNIAGLINVLDSLLIIEKAVYGKDGLNAQEFINKLDKGEDFYKIFDIPKHGTDNEQANSLANRLSTDICLVFEDKVPFSGGRFLPSSIQFTTYIDAGKNVGATPDGRCCGGALCDSIGAIHGNDKLGPTALLNSAASLSQDKMVGTPVLNIKIEATQAKKALQALALGYFKRGGMQMQVTCVNKEDLLDAYENPDKYPNLVVRIGGYSEYFNRLSKDLQKTVIERTVYS